MGTPHRSVHVDIDRDRVLDDDLEVEPDEEVAVPEHLDLPPDVPEADALEQQLDVPIDDEETR